MKEPAAVTDTHPLLFHAAGGRRLGSRAAAHFRACDEGRAITCVPAIVIWEVSLLARSGRIDLGRPLRRFSDDLFSNPAYQPLDLTLGPTLLAEEMRALRDPFDALICAAAMSLDLPLISRDAEIEDFGLIELVWL